MIGFLHPAIAASAVAAVALPIAIHLLFRRRRVSLDWAAMDLLREAVRRTNRRLRLEQWLVLALRSLAVLAAGLAIAAPVLEGAAGALGAEARVWMVVLDDGATSGLRTGSADELARLRDEVRAALSEKGPRDRIGLVLASAPARLVLAPTSDPAQFGRALDAASPRETPSDLASAIGLARAALEAEGAAAESGRTAVGSIVVASAFRQASVDRLARGAGATVPVADGATGPEEAARGEPMPSGASDAAAGRAGIDLLAVVPATDVPIDVRIASVEARAAPVGDAIVVRAALEREGASLEAATSRVRASADGCNDAPPREIAWEAGQKEASVEFQLVPSGVGEAPGARVAARRAVRVSIDDDALRPGNDAFAAVDVRREIEVGVVGRRGALDGSDLEKVPASLWTARALAPALGGTAQMRVREIDPSACDARALVGLDAVVVARPDLVAPSAMDALGAFVREGRVAIVLPAGETLAQGWSSQLFAKLGVGVRAAAEASSPAEPLRLAEEQPPSPFLSALAPELPVLVAPVESSRVVALDGHAAGEVVLAFADGSPFVVAQSPGDAAQDRARGKGVVVAFASAPELAWTNLPVKPLMVPLFQELVRSGLVLARGSDDAVVGSSARAAPGSTLVDDRGARLAVGDAGTTSEPLPSAGIWTSDDGSIVPANVAVASLALAPSARETVASLLAAYGPVRFPERDGRANAESREPRAPLAAVFLACALALLVAEGVVSRVFSHASVARASRDAVVRSTVGRARFGGTPRRDETAAVAAPARGGGA